MIVGVEGRCPVGGTMWYSQTLWSNSRNGIYSFFYNVLDIGNYSYDHLISIVTFQPCQSQNFILIIKKCKINSNIVT